MDELSPFSQSQDSYVGGDLIFDSTHSDPPLHLPTAPQAPTRVAEEAIASAQEIWREFDQSSD